MSMTFVLKTNNESDSSFPQSLVKSMSWWIMLLMIMKFLSSCGVFFSESILSLWVFLEVGMFSLVPMLLKYEHSEEQLEYGQSVMIYYVLKIMGSLFMMMDWVGGWDSWWVFIGIVLKIGLYPVVIPYMVFISRQYKFIFWYLKTISKIPLLCFVGKFGTGDINMYGSIMAMSFGISLWFYLKKVSSSLNNIYLSLAVASVLDKAMVMYLSYFKMSWALVYLCFYSLNLASILGLMKSGSKYLMGLFVLSVSGFPPFLGFYVKILGLVKLWEESNILMFLLMAMIFQSLIYVKILMDVFLQKENSSKSFIKVSWFMVWCVLQLGGLLILG